MPSGGIGPPVSAGTRPRHAGTSGETIMALSAKAAAETSRRTMLNACFMRILSVEVVGSGVGHARGLAEIGGRAGRRRRDPSRRRDPLYGLRGRESPRAG